MRPRIFAFLFVLALAAASGLPRAGWAQDIAYPVFSKERLSFAAGADYVWRTGPAEELQPRTQEWQAAVLGAYSLTKHVAVTASERMGLSSRTFEHRVGIRLNLGSD